MHDKKIEEWSTAFDAFLSTNHPDIKNLFHQRILFTPDKRNNIHLQLLSLEEPFAPKETIDKMQTVFNEYCKTNPI